MADRCYRRCHALFNFRAGPDGDLMDRSEFLRQLAAKLYQLMLIVRTDAARENLRTLAEDLEAQASDLEKEESGETCSGR